MEESTTYQAIFQEGFKKGFKKGFKNSRRKFIICQGKIKFGYPNDAVVEKLNSIDDLEQLEYLVFKMDNLDNWLELLADE